MIMKDVGGIFFSLDSALALIILMVLSSAIASINVDCYIQNYNEIELYHQARDTLELMAEYKGSDGLTILDEISQSFSDKSGDNGYYNSHHTADRFLKKILGKKKYCLVEMNHLKGNAICSNEDNRNAKNVGVAVKAQGNYLYKLYIWE